MYFKDLSPYRYRTGEESARTLNVGWLGRWRPLRFGGVPPEAVETLFEACRMPVNRTRGYHCCPRCWRPTPQGVRVSRGGTELVLGSAEIRVQGKDGVVYAAPDLIYHYVTRHGYRPPAEFVAAVLERKPDAQRP